jgi:hypothetical protein
MRQEHLLARSGVGRYIGMADGRTRARSSQNWARRVLWIIVVPAVVSGIGIRAVPTVQALQEEADTCRYWETYCKRLLERGTSAPRSVELGAEAEQEIVEWLNSSEDIREASIRCTSVSLGQVSGRRYEGLARFDNGEQVHVEVTCEEETGDWYFHADLPGLVVVLSGTLPGYEYTTIGRAFNAFFESPSWAIRTTENGATCVEFRARLPRDLFQEKLNQVLGGYETRWKKGDEICVLFLISKDRRGFDLWSVQRAEDVPLRVADFNSQQLLNWLFETVYTP